MDEPRSLHKDSRAVELLKESILEGRARMPGVVRQELLSGVRHHAQFGVQQAATQAFDDVPLVIVDYEDPAAADNLCCSAGISGGKTDFLLCAIAMRRRWAILTVDNDFARYAKKLPIRLLQP